MDWNVVFNFIYLFHDFNRKKQPTVPSTVVFPSAHLKNKKFSGPVGNRTLDLLLVCVCKAGALPTELQARSLVSD
jgi:hypothetical protein